MTSVVPSQSRGLRPVGGAGVRALLLCYATWALACAPADFDALTEQTAEPAECLDCLDGSSEEELDAGTAEDPDTSASYSEPDPVEQDAYVTQHDEASADAAQGERADAASSTEGKDASAEIKDAARDSASPDSGPNPPAPACDGAVPPCRMNQVERQMEACGNCARGTRTRSRTCAADGCSWGAWSAWSACANPATTCDPNGAAQTQTVACTTCGTRTQSRSCARDTCAWGPWSDTSACTWCEECSQVVYCDTPADIANRGTWCRQKACSREQALADCQMDVAATCGTTIQPFYMEYL